MDASEIKVKIITDVNEDKVRAIVNSELERAVGSITEQVEQHLIENTKVRIV